MSEVLVGALRYDVVMNTASVQDGTNITKQELKTLKTFFSDLVDPAAEYEAHLENIAKLVEKGSLTPEQGEKAWAAADARFAGPSGVAADKKALQDLHDEQEKINREKREWQRMLAAEEAEQARVKKANLLDDVRMERMEQQRLADEKIAQMKKGQEFFDSVEKKRTESIKETARLKRQKDAEESAYLRRRESVLERRRKATRAREKRHQKEREKLEKKADADRLRRMVTVNAHRMKSFGNWKRQLSGVQGMFKVFWSDTAKGNAMAIRGINSMTYGMGAFGSAIRAATAMVASLGTAVIVATAGIAAIVVGIVAMVKVLTSGVKAADKFRKALIDMQVLAGSSIAAEGLFKELRMFARESPYSVGQLSKLAAKMMSFGVASDRVAANLKMIGEIAGGDTERMELLAKAMNDVMAMGRLQGQELRQFANQGFNPLMQMMEETGKSYKELRKMMEDGLISAEMVEKAMKRATSEGGLFYERTLEGQKTIGAQFTKMKGLIEELMAKVGEMSGLWTAVYWTLKLINAELEMMLNAVEFVVDKWNTLLDFLVVGRKEMREMNELETARKAAMVKTIKDIEEAEQEAEAARKTAREQTQDAEDELFQLVMTRWFGEKKAALELQNRLLDRRLAEGEITKEVHKRLKSLNAQIADEKKLVEIEEKRKETMEWIAKLAEEVQKADEERAKQKLDKLHEELKRITEREKRELEANQKIHDDAMSKIKREVKERKDDFERSNQAASSFDAGSVQEYNMIRDMELTQRENARRAAVDKEADADRKQIVMELKKANQKANQKAIIGSGQAAATFAKTP